MKAFIRHPSLNWILVAVSLYCFLMLYTIPAEAKVVGKAEPVPGQDTITLHDERGEICPPNSFRAVYFISKTKETVEGCYVVKDGTVHLGFIDGDRGALPAEQFTWAPGARPSVGNDQPRVGPGGDTNGTPRPKTPIIATRGGAKVAGWM
jgi:hypothetical protein